MHQEHLYSVGLKHAVSWSHKRACTVCVLAEAPQSHDTCDVSLAHVCKQALTLRLKSD